MSKTAVSQKQSDSIDWRNFVDPHHFAGYVREIERHKSRNDCANDETVYIAESVEGDSPVGVPFAKLYLVGQCWLEVELIFVLFGNAYLKCVLIVEIFGLNSRNLGGKDGDSLGVDRDNDVLIEVAKFVQLPKGMILRRIRSLVRLQSVNFFRDVIREEPESPSVISSPVGVAQVFRNREVNVSGKISPSIGIGQLPSHLVEARPEAVQELPEFHPHNRLEGLSFVPLDVSSIVRFVLADDGVRFLHISGHVPVESVKVKFCPFRFCYEIPCGTRNHFRLPDGI